LPTLPEGSSAMAMKYSLFTTRMTVVILSARMATSWVVPASSDSAARWMDLTTTLNSAPTMSMSNGAPSFVYVSSAMPSKSITRPAIPPSTPSTQACSDSLNMCEKYPSTERL
jgi:hypothetical protein